MWARAGIAYARGNLEESADILHVSGAVAEEMYDRLELGRRLVEQGRRQDADVQLQRALAFYRGVGATRYIREAESLFAESA
jgi:hypothetical protein